MIPTSKKYFINNIERYNEDMFICYRDCYDYERYPMCYNVAHPKVWGEIFEINTEQDIYHKLSTIYSSIKYNGIPDGDGWSTDEILLFKYINKWNKFNSNFSLLKDQETGFFRMDRVDLNLLYNPNYTLGLIKNNKFTDYHMLRPYSQYKVYNDIFFNNILTFCDKK